MFSQPAFVRMQRLSYSNDKAPPPSITFVWRYWLLVTIMPSPQVGQIMAPLDNIVSIKEALLDTLFPRRCVFCDSARVEPKSFLCRECSQSVRVISQPFCSRCGLPIPGLALQSDGLCGRCLSEPPPYSRARYGVYYEGPLREALIRFKYYAALNVGNTLSDVLTAAFKRHYRSDEFDVIIAVPVHRKRLFQRGFNQAVILSAKLASKVTLPVDRRLLIKVKDTPPQARLPRAQRIANLRNSFGILDPVNVLKKNVLLIDDVATTGSTIAEATKTLLKAGASRVDALVLALRTADFFNPDQTTN
jgi:ComF family protein